MYFQNHMPIALRVPDGRCAASSYTLGFVGHEQDALGVSFSVSAWRSSPRGAVRMTMARACGSLAIRLIQPVEFVAGVGVEDSVLAGDVVVVHDLVVGG